MKRIWAILVSAMVLGAFFGCKQPMSSPSPTPPTTLTPSGLTTTTSSTTSSGAIAAYTSSGTAYLLAPALSVPGDVNYVNLTTLINKGVVTSLKYLGSAAAISGTSLDPVNDIGVAFNYYISQISFYKLSTATEITTYDTMTLNTLSFSGASGVKISGAIMDSVDKTVILATADGLQIVSYAVQTSPKLVKTIPSSIVNPTSGVEIMENFAFDPNLPADPMIITGGGQSGGPGHLMVLVDKKTGVAYSPDTATSALFTTTWYIDSAAVDSIYHVAILADENTGTIFVDLNQLTLNSSAGTYSLPSKAVSRITAYTEMDNLGLESTNHLLMMGLGFGGTTNVVAKLSDPHVALGFAQQAFFAMPSGNDNTGVSVSWIGGYDPHASGAFLGAGNTSMGIWLSGDGTHTALISLQNVLNGFNANPLTYAPLVTGDISYVKMP